MKIIILILFFCCLQSAIIEGYVKNSKTGKSIPNANIIIRELDIGVSTDPFGYFKLEIKNGEYNLETSVIGFSSDSRKINTNDQNIINIDLSPIILKYDEIKVQGILNTRMGNENLDIIKYSEINFSQKESISDFLKSIKGVDSQFSYPNGRNVNVSIRGSSDYKPGGYNNRVLVLLDGIPILIPNSGSPDWNSLPIENLQRIELNNTAASTQYGHNSMGGVINLITDHNNDNSEIKIIGGKFGSKQVSYTHNQKFDQWLYSGSIMTHHSNGHRYNSDQRISRFQSFIKYSNKGRNYKLNYLVSNSELGHPGFDLENSNKYRRSNRLSQYLHGKGFYPITMGVSMSHSLFINKFKTNYSNRDDIPNSWLASNKLDLETNYDDINYGLRSELIITKFSRWVLMLGYDIDWGVSDVDLLNQIYDNPSQANFGGFIQSKYSVGSGFSLISGIRYDFRNINPGNNFRQRLYNHFSPKINLGYMSKLKRSVNISYSRGFRAPSISELYLNHVTTYGLIVSGNPDLVSESVDSYEISYKDNSQNKYNWDFALFQNNYKNMIDFVYDIPTKAKNREGVQGKGFEIDISLLPIDILRVDLSYSYLDMVDLSGKQILYRSKHKGKIFFNILINNISINIGMQGQTRQNYENFLQEFDINGNGFPIEEIEGRIIPEFVVLLPVGSYITSFKASNLFDQKYELIQNYTMPGFNWQFSIKKKLNQHK